ncbi:hypothetical protein KGG85_gp33 [Streptomyces phage Tefunt]|uniref:Uncharacterized protein n=1 Tax=Streptomyces phage Tefunt TaxID=2041209 RepID=A0A291LIQ1_9CAUD|nr:hypothetical protein KGG85_gp33 [Streptomyces phage Tefunt]ATI18973.1 hypothetical protein SEA_TEFUNT_33 [Streptomyces phage Tefunt]AXH70237.1 hypothetical protein SEA_HAIZUM_33 [Streptomyces phage Haizum]
MSRVTVMSTVTYVVELDVPLGFLVDEEEFARSQSLEIERSARSSFRDTEAKLKSVKATSVVTAEKAW